MSIYHPTIPPKEKAHELIRNHRIILEFHPDMICATAEFHKTCIKHALYTVEQMTNIWKIFDGPIGSSYHNPGQYYWMQVKKELEKML